MKKMRELVRIKEKKNYFDTPIIVADATFDRIVQRHPIMMVDCWVPWCFPCQAITSIIEEMAKDYAGKVAFGKLNVDENPKTATRFGILGIPTLLILKNGKEVDRIVGAVPKQGIESKLQRYLRGRKEVKKMGIVNRVNLDRLNETVQKMKTDPSKAKRVTKIEGEWILDETWWPQFRAEIQTETGGFFLEADQPILLGGEGIRPSPMHYCLYGVAACTAATFATVAATEGVKLKKMRVAVEGRMDFSKTLGISDKPIVEEVKLRITVDSDADDKRIQELRRLAEERCPAVFCLTNPVKMTLEVAKEG